MKKTFTLLVFIFIFFYGASAQDFITKWSFPAATTSINFSAQTAGGAVSYTWSASPSGNSGSGSFTMTSAGVVTLSGMTIAAGDVVSLSMQPANLRRFYTNPSADAGKLRDVAQWGAVPWTSMNSMFQNCINLNISATDIPDLSAVTDMSDMFYGCTSLNSPSNINSWNTTTVTNMYRLFWGAAAFNQSIGGWNTENVTTMERMFRNATAFNQPIGGWNTGNVTTMYRMFNSATAFNQPISGWNTGNVTTMLGMFADATSFNQPIGNWNTSRVGDFYYMFANAAAFNQPINSWSTSLLARTSYMFQNAASFNQPIGNWNMSDVFDMKNMFSGATSFNQDIGSWTLRTNVAMSNMLDNSGMDYCNYSATIKGWASNNPAVTGRSLGAVNMRYTSAVANAERTQLVNTRGWTITGDAQVNFNPLLVAAGSTIVATPSCDEGVYLQPASAIDKVLGLNANGNSFNYGTAAVTVTNAFAAALPSGATTDASGFYEMNSGGSTFRVSRRLHTIQAPGSYTTNGGVIVRVYYDPAEITAITDNSSLPAGSNPLIQQGWFKSSQHSAQDVVNDMTASKLNNAIQVTPTGSGTENGVDYMEFTLPSFSTIGYYATTSAVILPVKLVYFTGASNGCAVNLQWKTALESNVSHFEIERSSDAVHYSAVYTQVPATQSTGAVYNYTDKAVTDGSRYYYRLKTVDNNGRYAYSSTITQTAHCSQSPAIEAYPNPATDYVTVKVPAAGGVMRMYAVDGRLVETHKVVSQIDVIDVTRLAKGVYMLCYKRDNEMMTIKLSKR